MSKCSRFPSSVVVGSSNLAGISNLGGSGKCRHEQCAQNYNDDHPGPVVAWKYGFRQGAEHSCSDQTYPRSYRLRRDAAKEFDIKASMLLAARAAARPVRLRYSCDANGVAHIVVIRMPN